MADDIQIKLGLDAGGLFASLQKAFAELQKIAGVQLNINAGTATSEMSSLAKQASTTKQELDKVKQSNFDEAKKSADGLSESLDKVGKTAGSAGGVMEGLKSGLQSAFGGGLVGGIIGGGLSQVVSTAVGAVANAASAAFEEYRALDANIQNIGTLGVEAAGLSLQKFEGLINDLSTRAPDKASNIANGVYNAISAGITGSEEEIVKFVETASRVGVAGVSDTNAAVNGLTSVVNAYGLGAAGAEQTSNIFFATIKAGKTSFNELNAGLANIIPAASAAGIQFDEVGGAIAKLTTVGIPTAQATTQLRAAIIELQKPGKPLAEVLAKVGLNASNMGEQLKKPASEGGGLINTLQMVEKAAKASGLSMTQVFSSSEAASASLSLTGKNAASALSIFEGVQKDVAEGVADKAYEAASKSIDVQFAILGNKVQGFFNSAFSGLKEVANIVVPIFTETLGPTIERFSETMSGYFTRIWSVVQPILAAIGGSIVANLVYAINGALVVIDTLYSILSSVFDALVKAFTPLVDVIKNVFGLDGAMGESIDIVESFKAGLMLATEIVREIGIIVADFGGLLVEFLITPIQLGIEVIADIIRTIAGWMSTNDENTKSIKGTGEETNKAKGFVDTLRTAFDNIRGTIGGVKEAFIQVKTTIAQFWDAITQFDLKKALDAFSGFGDKLSKAYDKGFNATKDNIVATREAEKKAAEQKAAEEDSNNKKTEKKDKDKKDKKAKDTFEALDKLKKDFAAEQTIIANANMRELSAARQQGLDIKAIQERQDKEEAERLKLFLNKALANVDDANVLLNEKQLVAKIKPANPAQFAQLESFYLSTIEKLSNDKKIEPKFKLPDFKDVVKEFEAIAKDIEKTASVLIPVKPVDNEDALTQVKGSVADYVNFIKIQNEEIANARTEAILAGNTQQANALNETILNNDRQLRILESRLADYEKQSRKEIENSNIYNQISNALKLSLLDQFNGERLRQERETNQKIRDERLSALNTEEKDLQESLANRSISFEDYASRIDEINKQRVEAEESTNLDVFAKIKAASEQAFNTIAQQQSEAFNKSANDRRIRQAALDEAELAQKRKLEGLKGQEGTQAFIDAQAEYEKAQKAASDNDAKIYGIRTSTLEDFAGSAIAQFGQLAASGKATLADFGNAAAGAAFDAVSKMIPSFVAGILGNSVTTLGPILGPLAAAALTGTLYGLLGLARSAAGFKDGVVSLNGPGTETSDSIPAWLSRGESVITAKATKSNFAELEWMNKTGRNISDYYLANMSLSKTYVNDEGIVVEELRKLRTETKNLGRQITRRTIVEVSGELSADSKMFKAVIQNDKRRNARRS